MSWARNYHEQGRPHAHGGVCVSFVTADEGQQRVKQVYGAQKCSRLARLKRKWDPDDLFRSNKNIRPAD
jgi:hypothetical protein